MTTVLALDLSLTASGVCLPTGHASCIRPKEKGMERLAFIRRQVLMLLGTDPTLVAIEGYAFARANQAHQIGELGGVIRLTLHEVGQPYVEVSPGQVKKYATGKGNAKKPEMLAAAIRRLGYEGHDDNEADALWLRALVLDAVGEPVVTVPAVHREALAKVQIPEAVARG